MMMNAEPTLKIGISEGQKSVFGRLNGRFVIDGIAITGVFEARFSGDAVHLYDSRGQKIAAGREIKNAEQGNFAIQDVIIGKDFHWERKEEHTFEGSPIFLAVAEGIITINEINLEQYLSVVISSEMSGGSPYEFLKTQAVVARSWSMATLNRQETDEHRDWIATNEVVCWYGRGRHKFYDFCADDHCQRYHGIGNINYSRGLEAATSTKGLFLVHGDEICDARYHKACGGWTERYGAAWEDDGAPYLTPIDDSRHPRKSIYEEEAARKWLLSSPDAFCNIVDKSLLAEILPNFDQETPDFFRWHITCSRRELEAILGEKSGVDCGDLRDIVALQRGASGRIYRLLISGTQREIIVGKELEIRRLLSRNHLYSSAFVVEPRGGDGFLPDEFIFHGGGWGHGVGLCQIGAANMAAQGFCFKEILRHYFPQARVAKFY